MKEMVQYSMTNRNDNSATENTTFWIAVLTKQNHMMVTFDGYLQWIKLALNGTSTWQYQ